MTMHLTLEPRPRPIPAHGGWFAPRIKRIAAELRDRGLAPEELLREGWTALGEARRRWHPDLAVPFLGYAEARIRERMVGALMLRHQGLIWTPAIAFKRYGIEEEELVSEGQFVLLRAIDGFDPGRGYKFSTYATHAIKNQFLKMLREHRDRERSRSDVAPADLAAAASESWDEGAAARARAVAVVAPALAALPVRWAEVVKMRYGFEGYRCMTLDEVGDVLGITKERIRQIQHRAQEKLKAMLVQVPCHDRSDPDG